MSNISREVETPRKNLKKMLEIKTTVTEMKNAFGGLINRLNIAEERINKLEEMSVEPSTLKFKKKKNQKE